jgi:dipeptidyl-peptidase 4
MKKKLEFYIIVFYQILMPTCFAQKIITNEDIWAKGVFRSESVDGINSMKDGVYYTSLEQNKIVRYEYKTGNKVNDILNTAVLNGMGANLNIDSYQFSDDEKKILIQTETEGIYRYSSRANYFIIELDTKNVLPLTDFSKGKQSLADFSPSGNQVTFVRNNNIFISDINTKTETVVTTDGEKNRIINGATDWVYEEEFGFDKGFYWSPAGTQIAYYRFDETNVKNYGMDTYGSLYPQREEFKYPKAGEENSKVSIFIYDTKTKENKKVDIELKEDYYIPRIKWTKQDNQLCIMRMNRHQNTLEFLLANSSTAAQLIKTSNIYNEKSETYIDINDNLIFLNDGKAFLWNSEKNGYNHIYMVSIDGKIEKQITTGNYDAIDFYGFDESKSILYYTASDENPTEKSLFSIKLNGKNQTKLNKLKGQNDAVFSASFAYYINFYSAYDTPPYITLHEANGNQIRVLEDNAKLKQTITEYEISDKSFGKFTTSQGTELNYWIIKPYAINDAKKYPVLLTIYGGPGSNTVTNQWGGATGMWHQMLAEQGYVVVSVDPRGTQFRGKQFKHSTYLQLGKLETEDFIEVAKWLGSLDFVDKSRIGIQGWSYGGYMTSLCMTKGADYFKAGIAVAPVTNWKYYDSIYTERFLRTPKENPTGYEDNSPINFTDKLKGKFLLVHGSADDNVHLQNTMDMTTALVKSNKQYDLFIYPNKNHGISGGNTRLHLFTKMTEFLKSNL